MDQNLGNQSMSLERLIPLAMLAKLPWFSILERIDLVAFDFFIDD